MRCFEKIIYFQFIDFRTSSSAKINFIIQIFQIIILDYSIEKINQLMLAIIRSIMVLLIVINQSKSNLICNGDFENSSIAVTTPYTDSMGRSLLKNSGVSFNSWCWYTSTILVFSWEIKEVQKANLLVTRVANFISPSNHALCQDVSLKVGSNYSLSFDYLIDEVMTAGSVKVTLNYAVIYNTTLTNNSLSLRVQKNMTATASMSRFCFQDTGMQYRANATYLQILDLGSMIDNITLIEIVAPPVVNTTNSTNVSSSNSSTVINATNSTNVTTSNTSNSSYASNVTLNASIQTNTTSITNIVNTTNITNATINTNTTNITNIANNIQIIIITFRIHCSLIQNKYNFISTFDPGQLGLTPTYFANLTIFIDSDNIFIVYRTLNQNHCLELSIQPLNYLELDTIKNSVIYFPYNQSLIRNQQQYLLAFQSDSSFVTYQSFSNFENKLMNMMDKSATSFVQRLYEIFIVMSSFSLTSLILGLVGFYNLTLMYVFLHMQTLPSFVNSFMYNLAKVFYARNAIPNKIKQIFGKPPNEPLFAYERLVEIQKVPLYQNQKNWFNFVKISSNFITNNFTSLLFFFLFIIRNILFKLLAKLLSKNIGSAFEISNFRIFRKMSAQLACTAPFFVVSSMHVLILIGEDKFVGIFNNYFQILTYFALISIPLIQFIWCSALVSKLKLQKRYLMILTPLKYYFQQIKVNELKQNKERYTQMEREWIGYNAAKSTERLLFWCLCISVPSLTVAQSRLGFFLVVTPVVFARLYVVRKHFDFYTLPQKVLKLSSCSVWIIYHSSFIVLYILQILLPLLQGNQEHLKWLVFAAKYVGFVIVVCLLLGGMVDLLVISYKIMLFLLSGMLFIINKLKNNTNKIQSKNYKLKQDLVNKKKQQIIYRLKNFSTNQCQNKILCNEFRQNIRKCSSPSHNDRQSFKRNQNQHKQDPIQSSFQSSIYKSMNENSSNKKLNTGLVQKKKPFKKDTINKLLDIQQNRDILRYLVQQEQKYEIQNKKLTKIYQKSKLITEQRKHIRNIQKQKLTFKFAEQKNLAKQVNFTFYQLDRFFSNNIN